MNKQTIELDIREITHSFIVNIDKVLPDVFEIEGTEPNLFIRNYYYYETLLEEDGEVLYKYSDTYYGNEYHTYLSLETIKCLLSDKTSNRFTVDRKSAEDLVSLLNKNAQSRILEQKKQALIESITKDEEGIA